MTTHFDASRYQLALERWRALAERRLQHITLLYETGRWRRYFNEEQFLGIIRETRAAVEAWQRIAPAREGVAQLFAMPEEPSARTQPPPSPFAAAAIEQRSVA